MEETRLRCENARLQEELSRIEALEWLIEVQTLYLMWMHSCVRLVQSKGWRSELSITYHKALRDAGME